MRFAEAVASLSSRSNWRRGVSGTLPLMQSWCIKVLKEDELRRKNSSFTSSRRESMCTVARE